jgi:hypothetical protein
MRHCFAVQTVDNNKLIVEKGTENDVIVLSDDETKETPCLLKRPKKLAIYLNGSIRARECPG